MFFLTHKIPTKYNKVCGFDGTKCRKFTLAGYCIITPELVLKCVLVAHSHWQQLNVWGLLCLWHLSLKVMSFYCSISWESTAGRNLVHHHRGGRDFLFNAGLTQSGWAERRQNDLSRLYVTRGQHCTLPTLRCLLLCRVPELHRFGREGQGRQKSSIALQGKLVRPKLEFLCVGGCEQWQLSVRQRLQRSAEWLLWVILCCRSLRKFTDVFSYETPL